MESNILIDRDIARILDLLEQIKAVNKMIDMHQNESGDRCMKSQYVDLKNRFLGELKPLLNEFEVEVVIKEENTDKAA